MQEFAEMYYRPRTMDVRFTLPALAAARGWAHRTKEAKAANACAVLACGAVFVGKARVGNVMKDCVYSVPWAQWGAFVAGLDGGPIAEPRLTLEQRVARLEELVAGLVSTDTP